MRDQAAGIDLGGTKIEAQLFDSRWSRTESRRVPTPISGYADLLDALLDQINWCRMKSFQEVPIGMGAPGFVDRETGLAVMANLVASGHPLLKDLTKHSGSRITFVNDASAFTISEAVFGAGRGFDPLAGLVLGTGIGGDFAVNGRLANKASQISGGYGHMPLPAALVSKYRLPIHRCGCGKRGCFETIVAGPGLARLARNMTGRTVLPKEIAAAARASDPEMARVWSCWCETAAELLSILQVTLRPACVVLGGGLSKIDGMADDLARNLRDTLMPGLAMPKIVVAERSDASGARGAAYAAFLSATGSYL